MDIKQQWQCAVEEFGDRAHDRFFVNNGVDSFSPTSNKEAIENLNELFFIPSVHLFEHGVSVYGFESEKQMWEFKGFFGCWQNIHSYASYNDVINAMANDYFYDFRRKTSAELPFSLERALSGDVIEGLSGGKWEVKNGHTVYSKFRMKYPPKLENQK